MKLYNNQITITKEISSRPYFSFYVENSLSRAYNESMAPGYPGANRREARKLGLITVYRISRFQ